MSFWRKQVIDFALDHETRGHVEEQLAWIVRERSNPQPYYNLAQLYRMQYKQDEGLALLLEAVHLDAGFGPAHVALTEIYAVRQDYNAAWSHARAAEQLGDASGVSLLKRNGIAEPS